MKIQLEKIDYGNRSLGLKIWDPDNEDPCQRFHAVNVNFDKDLNIRGLLTGGELYRYISDIIYNNEEVLKLVYESGSGAAKRLETEFKWR